MCVLLSSRQRCCLPAVVWVNISTLLPVTATCGVTPQPYRTGTVSGLQGNVCEAGLETGDRRPSTSPFSCSLFMRATFNQTVYQVLSVPSRVFYPPSLQSEVTTQPLSAGAATLPLLSAVFEELPGPRHLGCNFSKVKRKCQKLVGLQLWRTFP